MMEQENSASFGYKTEFPSVNVTFRDENETSSQHKESFRESEMYKISFAGPEAI